MSNYVEFPLGGDLTMYVFIVPSRSPDIRHDMDQLTITSFNKDKYLLLKAGKISMKNLGIRAFAGVPCIMLIYLKRNTSTVQSVEITITPETQDPISIFDMRNLNVPLKELTFNDFDLTNSIQATAGFCLMTQKDGFIQISLNGLATIDQRKYQISKKFAIEAALPFIFKSKISNPSDNKYFMEISVTNAMQFPLNNVSYSFAPNTSFTDSISKTIIAESIPGLSTIRKIISLNVFACAEVPKKAGKFSVFWYTQNDFEFSALIQEEPTLNNVKSIPDYIQLEIEQIPKSVELLKEFTFSVKGIVLSAEDIQYTATGVDNDDFGIIKTEKVVKFASVGDVISIECKCIPLREGLGKLPKIHIVLDNFVSFNFDPDQCIFVTSPTL